MYHTRPWHYCQDIFIKVRLYLVTAWSEITIKFKKLPYMGYCRSNFLSLRTVVLAFNVTALTHRSIDIHCSTKMPQWYRNSAPKFQVRNGSKVEWIPIPKSINSPLNIKTDYKLRSPHFLSVYETACWTTK